MIISNQEQLKINPRATERDYISNGNAAGILYLVPTNRRVRALKKSLLEDSPGSAVADLNVHTLSTFCSTLFFRDDAEGKIATEAVSSVLLSQCFRELKPEYFRAYSDGVPRGTLDRIRNVINQYKRNGVEPADLIRNDQEFKGAEKRKAESIAAIYAHYKTKFHNLNIFDIGDVYSALLGLGQDNLAIRFTTAFSDIRLIVADGFTELTVPEAKILSAILNKTGIPGYFYIDYHKKNHELFSKADEMIENLRAQGLFEYEEREPETRNFFLEKFAYGLFNFYYKDSPLKQDKITIIAGTNFRSEVELIAQEIKELCADGKIKPSEIGVVFNLIEDYSAVVRDVFTEYDIAFNLSDRYRVDRNPLIVSIVNLLELSENDYYYKNLFRALSGRLINLDGVKLNDFMRAASELKIVGGYSKWMKALERVKQNQDEEEFSGKIIGKEEAEKLEAGLKTLNKYLSPFRKNLTISSYRKEIYSLLEKLKVKEKLLSGNRDEDEKNVKAIKAFLRDFDATFALLEEEYGSDTEFSQAHLNAQVRTIVSSSRYNIREKPNYGVLITTPDEVRGLKFKAFFIGGLFENNFPTKYSPEIFMPEKYRKDETKHRRGEQYLFYQAISSFSDKLYFTYPVGDGKKKLVRSNFLDECTRIFQIHEKTEKDYEANFYSYIGRQIYYGEAVAMGIKPEGSETTQQFISLDKLRLENETAAGEYAGIIPSAFIDDDDLVGNKAFSASALELYAGCPFKYFTEKVLHLRPLDEPVESIEPVEFGSILHQVLYEFIKEIIESGRNYLDYISGSFDEACGRLLTIAKEKLGAIFVNETESFFEIEKILGIGGAIEQSVLYKFLLNEREAALMLPVMVERGFEIEFPAAEELPSIKLHGKIDRIDADKESGYFKVVDYKSGGKTPDKRDLRDGLSLQLPLYMIAAQYELRALEGKDFNPVFPEIYSLKFGDIGSKKISTVTLNSYRGDYTSDSEKLKNAVTLSEELAKSALSRAREYAAKIANGEFYLSRLPDRKDKVCVHCDHNTICRVRETE